MTVPHVYTAMLAVMKDLGSEGLSKDRRNKEQGFNFRGVEDLMNALTPLLVKHSLLIIPRFDTHKHVDRLSQKGTHLSDVYVSGEFDFVSAVDGSKHTAKTYGQGMDSADKATNKAMSGAFKYCCFFGFCVPTEGVVDDADYDHPEVKGEAKDEQPRGPKRDARGPEDHDRRDRGGDRPDREHREDPRDDVATQGGADDRKGARQSSKKAPRLTPLPDGEEEQSINWRVENCWPLLLSDVVSAGDETTLKMAFGTAYKWAKGLPNENIGRNLLAGVQEKYEAKKKEMGL